MRIEDLNIFISIAKYRSISETARREHFTQPAVSGILASLEKQLGTTLIERYERQKQPLKLTSEGEILLQYAKHLVAEYQNMLMDITYNNISQVPFTIGCGRSFSVLILPSLVTKFNKAYPNASLNMKTYLNTTNALDALVKHECDLTLSSVAVSIPGLSYERLMDDPFLLACPLEMDISDEITIKEMATLPFVMREEGSFTYSQIKRALIERRLDIADLNIIMTVHDNAAIKQAIEIGTGCGFVPRSALSNAKMRHNDCKIVKVKGLNINRSIFLVRRDDDVLNDSMKLFNAYAVSGKWYENLFIYDPKNG